MKKRELSPITVLALCLTLLPTAAFAAAETTGNCNGDHTGWTAWTDNERLPEEAGKYYLTTDVGVHMPYSNGNGYRNYWLPKGKTTLCLNGHQITGSSSGSSSAWETNVIAVHSDVTLNLHNCKDTGYIQRQNASYGAIGVFPDGTLNMYGGTI